MNNRTIELDLNNFTPSSELLSEFTLDKIKVKKILIEREIDASYDRIEVINLSIPTSLHLSNPNEFVTIKSDRLGLPISRTHTNVPIQTNGIKFSIEADITKIENIVLGAADFRDTIQKIPISFVVKLECKEHNIQKEKEYSFTILVKPIKVQLALDYEPLIEELEYEEEGIKHIGNLNFSINKKYGFFYHEEFRVNMNIKSDLDRQFIDVDLNNIRKKVLSNMSLKVPVRCNMAKIENPKTPYTLDISINAEDPLTTYAQTTIYLEIKPDSTKTELQVKIADEDILMNGIQYQLKNKVRWKGVKEKSERTCFELLLSNLADTGDGLIKIRNLSSKVEYDSSKIKLVNEEDDLFKFDRDISFSLENGLLSTKKIPLTFRHDQIMEIEGKALEVNVPISFEYCYSRNGNSKEFQIKELSVCIRCKKNGIDFIRLEVPKDFVCPNCGSNKSGFLRVNSRYDDFSDFLEKFLENETRDIENNFEWQAFQSTISFFMEEFTGNAWLAIDFGTSASVVALADADTLVKMKDGGIFIDMKNALLRLYGQKYHDHSFGEENYNNIISSEILFRTTVDADNKTFLESRHYHEDVVQISPPKEILIQYSPFSVPYLKSLIGFDTIPDINGTYKKLKYHVDHNQSMPVTFEERPLSVEEVLRNVYNSLLRDFIKPEIEQLEGGVEVNDKIIISVPNTFTPKQVENIKRIIDQHFENFNSEYISFISESDAIACEYIANWPDHNNKRTDKTEIRQQDEYVMVYDVGAGTTDLTLFKLSKLLKKNKRDLVILGKFGKGTAGNYLDYLIALIIDEINPGTEKMTKQKGFSEVAHANKDFIKSYIKPNLQRPDIQFYVLPNGTLSNETKAEGLEIFIGQITDHELMAEYLEANSTEIIEQFFSLYSETDPFVSKEPKKSKIHTIVFSGRGVLFDKIRQSFENALRLFISDQYKPYVIFKDDSEKLKNVVAKGALNYAVEFRDPDYSAVNMSSRNLMARYGFLYRNPVDSQWFFLEVLNPSTEPLKIFPLNVYGLSIFEYDTDRKNAQEDPLKMIIDLSNTPVGYFVQSYSIDTARDFNEGNLDYITIMYSFSRENIANKGNVNKVPIRVQINEENQMTVSIGKEKKDSRAPLKIDFESNETFKKSLWPYV